MQPLRAGGAPEAGHGLGTAGTPGQPRSGSAAGPAPAAAEPRRERGRDGSAGTAGGRGQRGRRQQPDTRPGRARPRAMRWGQRGRAGAGGAGPPLTPSVPALPAAALHSPRLPLRSAPRSACPDTAEMPDGRHQPQPGDLIEIFRPFHHHWALYMGDGYVIHLTPADERKEILGLHKVQLFTGRVKKELLEEVVGDNEWRVNNESDQDHTPLPVQEIFSCAVAYTGREMKCHSFGSNCEDFVKKLRYGDQWRAFLSGEMDILDMRDDEEYPKHGDLIEIKREHYDHWALYVGDGHVIHVKPVDEGAPSLSGSSDTRLMRKAKVKKELLMEVARNKKWRVIKKYDCDHPPLPVEEIIWHAEDCVGKELTYDVFKSKSDDFLSKLRHVGLLRAFEGDKIHHQDTINRKYLPIPGDLIEIKWRFIPYLAPYQHWALYMGHGYVIHLTGVDGIALSSASVSSSHGEAMVKIELLEKVVKNRWWCVNNKYDKYRKPFPVQEIIRRAEKINNLINNPVPYRLLNKNCEHFVTKLRYGEAFSDQVLTRLQFTNIAATAGGVAGLIGLLSVPGVPLLAIAGAGSLLFYGSASNVIEHYSICAKFRNPGRDMLEQRCC